MIDSGYFPKGISKTQYLAAATCALGVLAVWKVIYSIFFSPLSHIPGPLVTAITPHYINLLSALNRRTVGTYSLHRRYGPIVRLSPTEVSVISRQAIKEVYSSPHYTKYTPLYSNFTVFGAQNAFTSRTREEHGWRRKAVSDTYSLSFVLKDEAATGKVLGAVKDYLGFVEKDRRVDVYLANTFYAADVVTGKIFGLEASMKTLAGNETHRGIILGNYAHTRTIPAWAHIEFPLIMGVFGWFVFYTGRVRSWVSGIWAKDPAVVSQIQEWGRDAYMDAKSNPREGTVAGRLATLVSEGSSTSGTGEVWDDRGAVSEVMVQMLAGMNTTSDTLSFLMYQLSLPESLSFQTKLHSELLHAFPKSAEVPCPSWPHSTDIRSLSHETMLKVLNLPYLDAVLKETLRMYSALPVTLPRVVPPSATTDMTSGHRSGRIVEGKFIPAGTIIGASAYGIHREEVFAVETERNDEPGDVDSFLPERWLIGGGIEGELAADELAQENQRVRTMEARLWAFGSGGRNCLGRHLSILEMKLLLGTIYSRYQTRVTPNSGVKIVHNRWNDRMTLRDVLPFGGVDGVITFTPYEC